MRSDRFDDLTRLLASGASRRQVLKGVLGAALGGFLSQAGLNFGRSEPVAAGPAQEADYQVFLPFVTSACSQASTCDNKVFCSADEQCRCIRSAEGPIRCGRPLACDVQLCTTSADCAHLGPGYFCDTPYSGCCTSPPASEARCIAPCTPPCPEDKICGADCCSAAQLCIDEACVDCPVDQQCGTTCCPEGQVCVDGTCGECPAARVCGTTCCPEGQGCLNGECVSDCDPRSVTAASLGAALRQLDSGANEVSLSPQGCIQYRREYRGEMLVLEETTVNGQLLFEWRYTVGQANGWRDRDLDGFFESRTATAFDDGTGSFRTVDTEYSPETRAPVRRQTLSPAEDDGMVHVLVEEADEDGTWRTVAEYDTPRVQESSVAGDHTPGDDAAGLAPAACEANPCNQEQLRDRALLGIEYAADCLTNLGDRGVKIYLDALETATRNIRFRCAPIPGETQANVAGWESGRGNIIMTVDPEKYCKLSEGDRSWLLFHEVLHAALKAGHAPDVDGMPLEQRKNVDRVYGCIALCYTNRSNPTQCMCARCLDTLTCDAACVGYNSDCGAICPCPASPYYGAYFQGCSGCLAICPSGLGCFGYSYCEPVGHSGPPCPEATCP